MELNVFINAGSGLELMVNVKRSMYICQRENKFVEDCTTILYIN